MEGDNPIKCTVHCGSKEICSPGCEGGEIQIEIDGNKKTIDVDCKRKPGQGGFNCDTTRLGPVNPEETTTEGSYIQGGFDGWERASNSLPYVDCHYEWWSWD